MKKGAIFKLIFIILIIVLVIVIVGKLNQNNNEDLTINLYNEICEKTQYTFKIEVQNSETQYVLTFVKNGSDIVIDTVNGEEHSGTLYQDDYLYVIMHDMEEYTVVDYSGMKIDADVLKGNFTEIEGLNYESGYEEIEDEKCYYEEYSGVASFDQLLYYDGDEEIKTRFYYKNGEIKYIKTIIGEDEELLKIEYSDSVDESYLEIPSYYAES